METIEEVAERMSTRIMEIIFEEGAKWQQERSYSEEEVNEMFDTLKRNSIDNVATIIIIQHSENGLNNLKRQNMKYRNLTGEYLYLFNWVEGGFNDVWAKTKREAYAKVMRERRESAEKYPTHVKLTPDYGSMRRCTYDEYQQQNRMGWMLSN